MPFPESEFWSQFSVILEDKIPNAAFIFELNEDSSLETIKFLLTKFKTNHLNVQRIILSNNKKINNVFLITCNETLLLNQSKFVYQKQQLKRQINEDENVVNEDFTDSEKQRIIQHILENIKIETRTNLIGMSQVKCYSGQSLVEICYREKVILSYFPLHDNSKLNEFSQNFYSTFAYDINSIRNYFGEKIAFYFSFLNFYMILFMSTSIVSNTGSYFSNYYLVTELLSLANCLILFLFWKFWSRESCVLAFQWGTFEAFELEKARLTFRSKEICKDSVTGELIPSYPIHKTWLKEYGLSIPIVLFLAYIAFEIMCIYFRIENWTIDLYNENPSLILNIFTYFPSIFYTILIFFMNKGYKRIAEKLNEYENHRTQASHENHLIIKLVLFECINNFMSLFYIAFYMKNIEMLQWNLFTMLTINQFFDNIIEVILPFFQIRKKIKSKNILQIHDMLQLEDAHDTYYDYLELFIQFGLVFLFLPIFPLGPVIGLINSYMEIRLDGMKYCFCLKRPLQRSAEGINNGWIKAFEFLTIGCVISNLALISMSSQRIVELAQYYDISVFTLIIIVEHLLCLLILIVWNVIPKIPKKISVQLSKQRFLNMKNTENLKKND